MRNFMEWVLAEAEVGPNGKQDVITYLSKSWLPLVKRGNYFVYIPDIAGRPDDLKGGNSSKPRGRDFHGKMYAPAAAGRRDVPKFNYYDKGTTAYGLDNFLRVGLGLVSNSIELVGTHSVLLLTVNQGANIQCLDAKSDQTNPYQWINERLHDYKVYAKSLQLTPEQRANIDREMATVEKEIQSWYRNGVPSQSSIPNILPDENEEDKEMSDKRLQKLLWYINVEIPRVIGWYASSATPNPTTGTHANNNMAGNYRQWHSQKKSPPFTDGFKGVRDVGVDIISHTCPTSTSNWVLVFNPKAIRVVDSVMVDQEFRGLKRVADKPDQVVVPSKRTREYDAINVKLNDNLESVANILDHIMGDEIYFGNGGSDSSNRMLVRKKNVIKRLKYAGMVAASLAENQPEEKDELISRFQHLLDQIEQEIEQNRTSAAQAEEHPDEVPQGMSVEEMKAEAQHWTDIEKAFTDAIEGIRKAGKPKV